MLTRLLSVERLDTIASLCLSLIKQPGDSTGPLKATSEASPYRAALEAAEGEGP